MCVAAPVIVSLVAGVVGSIASYQQQQQQVSYQNAVAQQQADYQNAVAQQQWEFSNMMAQRQFDVEMSAFTQSEQSFQQQIELNNQAANRAYVTEQEKLNFEQKQAALEAQNLMASSMRAQGTILSSGRSGQSIGLMAADASKEYSRDLAILGLNLGSAYADYSSGTQSIFEQAQSQQNIAQSNRMLEPMAPIVGPQPIPIRAMSAPRPSPLGLISNIAGAGVSAYQTQQSLQPPPPMGQPLRPGWPALQPLPPI